MMAIHEMSVGASNEWYTPEYVFKALGCTFDMDVAGSYLATCPARRILTSGGLETRWEGFVWMNPPFGGRNGIEPWLAKFRSHKNGIALAPDRTSAPWFQRHVRHMERVLFVSPKIRFIPGPGVKESSPGQGTCLMALGKQGVDALIRAQRGGLGLLMTPDAAGLKETEA